MGNITRLYLIRHAETNLNLDNRYLGKTDVSLNSKGIVQAELMKKLVKNLSIDVFFTSPLKRAKETCEIMLRGKNMPIKVRSELSEINFGLWEGLTYDEVKAKYLNQLEKWERNPLINKPPQGETMTEVSNRVSTFYNEILDSYRGKDIAIVSSGGVLNILLCFLFEIKPKALWQFSLSAASLSKVLIYPNNQAVLTLLNDNSHLKEY